jgi:uncharacterized protein (TIGR00159 family)
MFGELTITLDTIYELLRMVADISIVWVFIYFLLKLARDNARMILIIKGLLIIIFVKFVSGVFVLSTTGYLIDSVITYGVFALIVIFQPEIRNALEQIGKNQFFFKSNVKLTVNELDMIVNEITVACREMSQRRIGALITIERNVSLASFITRAKLINSELSSDLLTTIFTPSTALHDGAVIIQGKKIVCASAYYPVGLLDKTYTKYNLGTRHRAAMGISEISDGITIIVSEETGNISIAYKGVLKYDVPVTEIELVVKMSFQEALVEEGK